jgi:peptidoglycan/xylan/chitin deacetylase (PgdA/CDA1 family)
LYHDIPYEEFNSISASFVKLKKRWRFITPKQFEEHINGKQKLKGKNLLLTFDDGFLSNKHFAKEILDPLQIKAIFFVVPNFINITDSNVSRKYVSNFIYPSLNYNDVPLSWTNMNWDDLSELINNGHTIGAHTMSHIALSSKNDLDFLEKEIVQSANYLEEKLNIQITHFAFPFGNIDSFSIEALNFVKNRFDFCHSGLRGSNHHSRSHLAIRRDSLSPFDNYLLINAFILGFVDIRYKKSIDKLESWIFRLR